MSSRAIRTGHARSGNIRPDDGATVRPFPAAARKSSLDAGVVAPNAESRELWVAVHLPWLAIEALTPIPVAPARIAPRAIIELEGQTQFVVAFCEIAERMGVRGGMSLAAALARVPQLETLPRDVSREQQLLERLATRVYRFTPRVSLAPPDGLLLEVKGSLHLFGGAEGLCRAVEAECRAAGVKPLMALAPAPLAALAGARAGKTFIVTQPAHLVGQIAPLSLLTLRWPVDVLERLKQIGVRTIGEALRLPRAGFARRFGKAQLAMLDRLTGRATDPRSRFEVRERFQRRHELLYELEHHEALLRTLEPLVQELGAFLKARQCGITRLDCLLRHRHAPPTRCVLRLATPAASAAHLTKLLGERLAALSLPEPVRGFTLRSGAVVSRAPVADSLWQPGEHGGGASAEAPELIEHLRARLGHEAVYGLQTLAGHRPETAWRAVEPGATATGESPPWPAFRRPAWLLPAPQVLSERAGLPRRRGPLRLIGGPERVETAWWDGGDIARDYYVALDIHDVRLWIFRERLPPHRWFLQGVFG